MMPVKSGPYSPEERERIQNTAQAVKAGRTSFSEAVSAVASELGRSERGVSLLLGRTVQRIGGEPRAASAAGLPKRVQGLLSMIKTLSRQRERLVAKRNRLDSQIADLDKKLDRLKPRLMAATGLPEALLEDQGAGESEGASEDGTEAAG